MDETYEDELSTQSIVIIVAAVSIVIIAALFGSYWYFGFLQTETPDQVKSRRAEEQVAQQRAQEEQELKLQAGRQRYAEEIMGRIRYMKDSRTGICFAFFGYTKGAALAAVPCDNIPQNMLDIAINLPPRE